MAMIDRAKGSLRQAALRKIASLGSGPYQRSGPDDNASARLESALTASKPTKRAPNGTARGSQSLAKTPMTIKELQVLLALCTAAPHIGDVEAAESFIHRLEPYILEAPEQTISPSPFLKSINPSPWENLTFQLIDAVLSLALRYNELQELVFDLIQRYLTKCAETSSKALARDDDESSWASSAAEVMETLTVYLSILGFLSATSDKIYVFNVNQRYEIAQQSKLIINDQFLTSLEGVLSSIRHVHHHPRSVRDFQALDSLYAKSGRPLGAMLLQQAYLRLLLSCSALEIATIQQLQSQSVLDYLLSKKNPRFLAGEVIHPDFIELLAESSSEAINLLDEGADYLQLGSSSQRKLAFKARATSITIFLVCMLVDEDIADLDLLMVWLETSMANDTQMADQYLAATVLKSLAVVAKTSQSVASVLSKTIPRFIVRSGSNNRIVLTAAKSLAVILQLLSQDAVITGIYSLGNILSTSSTGNPDVRQSLGYVHSSSLTRTATKLTQHTTSSAISLGVSGDEETTAIYCNVVCAIVTITRACADDKITSLALSMLLQKLGRVSTAVDLTILRESAHLGLSGSGSDLRSLLKLYDRVAHDALVSDNRPVLDSLSQAWTLFAVEVPKDSALYQICLLHLLEAIVSKGDLPDGEGKSKSSIDAVAKEITFLLKPLALLAPYIAKYGEVIDDESTDYLQREVWFNLAVHGVIPGSSLWQDHLSELVEIARYSKPLILEDRTDRLESDIDLNTVLRRGVGKSRTDQVKEQLSNLLPGQEAHIKSLSYPKVLFILAAYSVETLRAETGHCSEVLTYFMDPICKQDDPAHCLHAVANEVMTLYLRKTTSGIRPGSIAGSVASELAKIFTACCHRNPKCQEVATSFADRLVASIPSALCQRASLFALLELLTLMWVSCLDAETQEYEVRFNYSSTLGNINLKLSDDFNFRRITLNAFRTHARRWLMQTLNRAPLDTRGLLQTYLSEYDDDGSYGHVSLGRSFALEIGTTIPMTDHKLEAISRQDESNINTGSDFMAQYTIRQEYKYAEALPEYDKEWQSLLQLNSTHDSAVVKFGEDVRDSEAVLAVMERRATEGKFIAIGELRDVLRRAAALLCRSKEDHTALIQYLVRIPFAILTKQSIKLGISVWLGVINENPRMETRVFGEIIQCWEETVRRRRGVFDTKLHYLDPFFVKLEFAPSDMPALIKAQQAVNSLISPHRRVLQFLTSRFSASRLGSPHLRRSIHRLVSVTLDGLQTTSCHPLLREFHFEVVSFGLAVLHLSEELGKAAKWRLKDRILSAGLAWFAHPPRWTYGGNRLQAKAETDLLEEIHMAFKEFADIGSIKNDNLSSLTAKQDLLLHLLDNERNRMMVWLFPLGAPIYTSSGYASSNSVLSSELVTVAWDESPYLAVQAALRAQSPALSKQVRSLILKHPTKALDSPEAVQLVLGEGLTGDTTTQLRNLLYWAPVNPITAAAYFLPAFGRNPFLIQYAMRALESHSVDVTFFYVPQLVQALRYDALGYVARYIVETAQFSQLFAHQIIWNMKANAYKDDDSTIPDAIKPTLDKVMGTMISTFSGTDKQFYEREFTFFDEITGISGKIKEILHKTKPEKNARIEEELHKITLEVGVYLPSNPDGVVVGIDRKSGKSLQSHAKAPYMATFRIRKTKGDMEDTDNLLEQVNAKTQNERGLVRSGSNTSTIQDDNTYEVWQSAIFKVGDDCRQDVLVIQLMAAFRGIFNSVGLDVYIYPYRVTATAPGCGVLDVLPKSISRDMLGRESVNGLLEYFTSQHGSEDSIAFQQARLNFVKSMASYSVFCWLSACTDRHNGNIMIDDAGHILHIDFGFVFDIAPGGVKFERAPFKLTREMVNVMGGIRSQSFRWFEELCIKAFLAIRSHADSLCHMVQLMMGSGLPCFKPETVKHMRERMVLEKSEREAAEFMRSLIAKSWHSYSTTVYDQFQLMQNGIPY